jgi:uncharacterized membrane protein
VIKKQITVIELSTLLSLLSSVNYCNRDIAEDFFRDLENNSTLDIVHNTHTIIVEGV